MARQGEAESLSSAVGMDVKFYTLGHYATRFVRMMCLDVKTLHLDRLDRPGPYLIACSHMGNLEPVLLSSMMDRRVRWIARTEYYRTWIGNLFLTRCGTIPIQRTGQPPVRAIRRSIEHLAAGEIVGIFPEGGVQRREQVIFRGGVNRGGAAVIAMMARVPILPVIMLGTEKFNQVDPWLPGRGGKLWISVGEPIIPPPATRTTRRQLRRDLTTTVGRQFVELYQQTLSHFGLRDEQVP